MAAQLDFSALLSRNNNHRPSRVAQLVPREALRPITPSTTKHNGGVAGETAKTSIDGNAAPGGGMNNDGMNPPSAAGGGTNDGITATAKRRRKKKAVYRVDKDGLSSTLIRIVDDDQNIDMIDVGSDDNDGDIYIVDVIEEEHRETNPISSSSEDDDEEEEENNEAEPMDIDNNDKNKTKSDTDSLEQKIFTYNDSKSEPTCLATHSWSIQNLSTKYAYDYRKKNVHFNSVVVADIATKGVKKEKEEEENMKAKKEKLITASRYKVGDSLPEKLCLPTGKSAATIDDTKAKGGVKQEDDAAASHVGSSSDDVKQSVGVHSHPGFYTYDKQSIDDGDNDSTIHWHVNFANPLVFPYNDTDKKDDDAVSSISSTSLSLTQEDHQMMEHPILVSLSKALDDSSSGTNLPKGLNRCTRQEEEEEEENEEKVRNSNEKLDGSKKSKTAVTPTPILVQNVPRQCSVNLLPTVSSDKDNNKNTEKKNFCGKEFYRASPNEIKQITKCINPPTTSNIVAMTAIDGNSSSSIERKRGRYTKNEILLLLSIVYTAFRAVVAESSKISGSNDNEGGVEPKDQRKRSVTIHTGFWGCGRCGGNKGLTTAIQILAAGAAGVDSLQFWLGDDSNDCNNKNAFRHAMEISKLYNGRPAEDIVNKLVKTGYRWGDVANPSHVEFGSATAAKDNNRDMLSLISPSDDVEMAGEDEKVDAVGEVMPAVVVDMEEEEKRREEEEEIELQRAARRDMEFFRAQTERMKRSEELAYELSSRTAEYERHAGRLDDEDNKKKKKKESFHLPSWVGADDDDPERRTLLERRRAREESRISHKLHEVELGDWEQNIDWEGAISPGGDVRGAVPSSSGGMAGDNKDPKGVGSAATNATTKTSPKAAGVNNPTPTASTDPLSLLHRPLNLSLDALDLTNTISWEGADAPPGHNRAIASHVNLILHESVAGRSMARLAAPTHRPEPFTSTAAFGLRCERELNASVTSTAVSFGGSLNPDSEKLEKIIEARQKKRAQMAKDKSHRVTEAMGTLALGGGKGRTITSSLMGPGGTERTGRPSRAHDSSSAHDAEYVEQLELVYNHTLVKPDLNQSELRHFHRPRLPARGIVREGRVWQFQVRCSLSAPTSGPKGVTSADGSTVVGSYHAMMSAHHGSSSHGKIRNEADLSASEGNLVLFEYCEERPPVQMSKGMACKIVNYYRGDKSRCPISAGGGDRPTRKRSWKKTAGTAGQGGPSGKVERPSRLLGPSQNEETTALDLIGTTGSSKAKTAGSGPSEKEKEKKAKEPAVDLLPEGSTEILHPKVHGPFMGEIEEGMTQPGLISNLFAAPIFRHEPEPSDFLMILGKKPNYKQHHREGAPSLGVFLRPLPSSTFCVGQTEPRVKVFAPNTTGEKTFQAPFVTYQIAKNLSRTETKEGRGLRFDEINDRLFANTVILPNALRQRIKQVASYDKNTQIWTTKPIGFEDFPGVEALGRRFSPEGVAAFETSRSAHRRLCDMGMHMLYSGSSSVPSVGAAMVYLTGAVNAARERKSKMTKMVEHAKNLKSSTRPVQIALYEKAAAKLEAAWKERKKRHEVARFIYEELQLAPWHLTSEFIDVHKHAQGTGMMKLTGLGDPSGIGEAYNFLREQDAKPNKGTGNSDGALNAQIKKITGTENDLRKLTMKQMASLLRSYGMGDKEISTLKRWDRVHVIRDLSTKAASDGMGDGLERYARGEKMKLSDQKQMYRERINEIWRRQRVALSTDAGSFDMARGVSSSTGVTSVTEDGTGDADAAALQKQLEKDMDDSDTDSDDDDDFAATFEEDLMDVKTTNELVAAQVRGSGEGDNELGAGGLRRPRREDTLEMSKDARDFAALQRQREEERAAQEGLLAKSGSNAKQNSGYSDTPYKSDRKCIRRRVTKTHPDGTQTTTFKFVVLPEEVEKLIAAKKKREEAAKKSEKASKKKGHKGSKHSEKKKLGGADADRRIVGHSMFEDEDEVDQPRHRSNIKLQVHRSTRVITTKTKKVSHAPVTSKAPPKPKKAKLQLGKQKEKKSQERRMKKRQREAEEADLYKRRGTSNRRDRGAIRERRPHVIMADRLESIRNGIEKRPGSGPFHRPVNRKALPKYYEVISEPIDLQTIRDKNNRYEYRTANAFLRDFDLMKNNAIKFNGVGSFLGNEATDIYEFVKNYITENREEFDAMETAVQEQLNSGRKRKKTSSNSKSASETTGNGSGGTAEKGKRGSGNVVLDGVAVAAAVDLANIPTNFTFGGDDSDSDDST